MQWLSHGFSVSTNLCTHPLPFLWGSSCIPHHPELSVLSQASLREGLCTSFSSRQHNRTTAQHRPPLRPRHQTPPSGQSVALLCRGGFSQAMFSLSWSKATSPPKAFPCCPASFRSCALLLDCLSPHPPLHLPARSWLRSSNPRRPPPPGSKRHKARTELGSPQGCLQ